MTERVHLGRLARAGQNHGAAGARFQIGSRGTREVESVVRQIYAWHGAAKFAGDGERDIAYQFRAQRYPMIGKRAGERP